MEVDGHPWREVDPDYAWARFDATFSFRPDFHERQVPAIDLPESALVLDLSPAFEDRARFAAAESAVDAAALRAFVWLAPEEDWLALDWQHPSYSYRPADLALDDAGWPVPVFPDGDYYAHMTADLRMGTFGHPWQRSLTVWGDDLVDCLGADLLTWLPRHPQSYV